MRRYHRFASTFSRCALVTIRLRQEESGGQDEQADSDRQDPIVNLSVEDVFSGMLRVVGDFEFVTVFEWPITEDVEALEPSSAVHVLLAVDLISIDEIHEISGSLHLLNHPCFAIDSNLQCGGFRGGPGIRVNRGEES